MNDRDDELRSGCPHRWGARRFRSTFVHPPSRVITPMNDRDDAEAVALFRYLVHLPPGTAGIRQGCARRPSTPTSSPAPGAPGSPRRRCAIG